MTANRIEPGHLFVGRTARLSVENVFAPQPRRNTDGCPPALSPIVSFAYLIRPADAGGIPAGRKRVRRCSMLGPRACRYRPHADHIQASIRPRNPRSRGTSSENTRLAHGGRVYAQLLASSDNSATTALRHAGEACIQQA